MADITDISGDRLVAPGAWSIGVVYEADKAPNPPNPPVRSVWIGTIPGTAEVQPVLHQVDRGYGPGTDVLYNGEIKFAPGNYPQYPFTVVFFYTPAGDGPCTMGSRAKAGAPQAIWLSYRDAVVSAVGADSPLATLAWLAPWPAAVVTDTAAFCSTVVPSKPAPLTALDFAGPIPGYQGKLRQFAEYTLWKQYCECIPGGTTSPGAIAGIEGSGNIPPLPAVLPPTAPPGKEPPLNPSDKLELLTAIQQCYCGGQITAATVATGAAVAAGTAATTAALSASTVALTTEVAAVGTLATTGFTTIQARLGAVDTAIGGVAGRVDNLSAAIPSKVRGEIRNLELTFVVFEIVISGDVTRSAFQGYADNGTPRYKLGWCAVRPRASGLAGGRGQEYFLSSLRTVLVCPNPGVDYTLEYGLVPGFTATTTKTELSIPLYQEQQ